MLRLRARREVLGGGHDGGALVLAHPDGDHLALEGLAETEPGVEPFGHDVHEPLVGADVDLHVGVLGEKRRHEGLEGVRVPRARDGEAQQPGRPVAQRAEGVERFVHAGERRPELGDEAGAGLREAHAARRPLQEPDADAIFEGAHGLAHGGRGDAELGGPRP